jgi:5-methyltetrahydrofolate--homocysteine methyltransferase
MALHAGLSLAIINPNSGEMQKAYKSYLALSGKDSNFKDYIAFATSQQPAVQNTAAGATHRETAETSGVTCSCCSTDSADAAGAELYQAILKGLGASASASAEKLIKTADGMAVVNKYIIPALSDVGESFEKQKIYLPQLMMSAEAANAAFTVVKATMKSDRATKGSIILATVKGDIHDIGKNIVKVLLENYGYKIIDLGRDVSYETILNSTAENNVKLVGLSALMTTTLPAMEETIKRLHVRFPDCKIMVGGAVLTEEYAKNIGADYYAADAMGAVRIAE